MGLARYGDVGPRAAALFALTRRPVMPVQQGRPARLPVIVHLGILAFLALGGYEVIAAMRRLRWWRSGDRRREVPAPRFQAWLWLTLLSCAAIAGCTLGVKISLVLLLSALILPLRQARPAVGEALPHRSDAPIQ